MVEEITANVGLLAEVAALATLKLITDLKLNKIFYCFIVMLQPLFWQAIVSGMSTARTYF
jgi:hypothetical protein